MHAGIQHRNTDIPVQNQGDLRGPNDAPPPIYPTPQQLRDIEALPGLWHQVRPVDPAATTRALNAARAKTREQRLARDWRRARRAFAGLMCVLLALAVGAALMQGGA